MPVLRRTGDGNNGDTKDAMDIVKQHSPVKTVKLKSQSMNVTTMIRKYEGKHECLDCQQ